MKAESSPIERVNQWVRVSVTIKIMWIGVLIFLLMIPTFMIQSLIRERESRSDGAVNEISSKWGYEQIVGGPVLSVPVQIVRYGNDGKFLGSSIEYFHCLPKTLNVDGELRPEIRKRGIYEAVLYGSQLRLNGTVDLSALGRISGANKTILWKEAVVTMNISDMRGLRDQVVLNWNNAPLTFNPGIPTQDLFQTGLSVDVPLAPESIRKEISFNVQLNLNGSRRLAILPMGETTSARLQSAWPSPSFSGDFLPEKREVSNKGFNAEWRVFHINRAYPQEWLGKSFDVMNPQFGVNLIQPVDYYTKAMRAAKYAVLFLFLTFLAFFLLEVFGHRPFHTIQYLLVGFSMCLFYLLLLSLSEHIPFGFAYIVASLTVVGLITGYTKGVFAQPRITTGTFLAVSALYAFLYSLLQMEDYALLFGTVALTVILGGFMYFTRKQNWFDIQRH